MVGDPRVPQHVPSAPTSIQLISLTLSPDAEIKRRRACAHVAELQSSRGCRIELVLITSLAIDCRRYWHDHLSVFVCAPVRCRRRCVPSSGVA
jgi:hypothetical protein